MNRKLLLFPATIALGILLLAGAFLASGQATLRIAWARPHSSAPRPHASGAIALIRHRAGNVLVGIRTASRHMTTMTLSANSRIASRDGRALSVDDLRQGDALVVQSGGQVQDTSQYVTGLTGIVSSLPASTGDALIVLLHQSWGIIVNVGSRTAYTDRSAEKTTLATMQEADVVRLRGVFDSAAGEMVRTDSIERVGPIKRPGTASVKPANG
jgi:hypothetical protein